MTAMLLCLGVALLALGTGPILLHTGLRTGDRIADTSVIDVEPDGTGHGVRFTVHNPGRAAVLIGASLRRRSLRLHCEGGRFVRVPRRTSGLRHLPRAHTLMCAVAAGETQMLTVTRDDLTPRLAMLVVAIGEADRLRVVHRAVSLPAPRPAEARADAARACAASPRSR